MEEIITENAFEGTGLETDRGLCIAWSVMCVLTLGCLGVE